MIGEPIKLTGKRALRKALLTPGAPAAQVFEYASMLEEGVGIHYPVHEVPSRSKLSCVCWNSYVKSNLIASDYDGTITLHDMGAGVEVRCP